MTSKWLLNDFFRCLLSNEKWRQTRLIFWTNSLGLKIGEIDFFANFYNWKRMLRKKFEERFPRASWKPLYWLTSLNFRHSYICAILPHRQTDRRSHTTVLYARINAHKCEFESLTFRLLAEEEKQTVFSKSSFENTDRSIEKNRRETTFRPHPKKTNPHQYSQS